MSVWLGVLSLQMRYRSPHQGSLAEWSNALAQGASPQGRGIEAHSCHYRSTLLLRHSTSSQKSTHSQSRRKQGKQRVAEKQRAETQGQTETHRDTRRKQKHRDTQKEQKPKTRRATIQEGFSSSFLLRCPGLVLRAPSAGGFRDTCRQMKHCQFARMV